MLLHGLRRWRPLNGRPGLRVAVLPHSLSPVYAGLSLRPIGCMLALSVTQSAAAVCDLWRYISDEPLAFLPSISCQ